ncbi:hypothetical protein SFRURICE_015791, partial [Spodoptera frugiperda]
CLLYADDLKIFTEIRTESDCVALQDDVNAIFEWGRDNKMEFNLSKCRVVTFGRMRRPINTDYKLGDSIIERAFNIKDLGVTFDQKLTFHDHMVAVARDSFRRLGFVLRNARDFHSQHVIKLLYNTFVRSKLESSAAVWNPHESTYELLLEKIIHGHIDAPDLHNEFLRIFAPDNYCRNRKHQLFAIPSCRTVSRAKSSLPRTMKLLNRFLDSKPECDVFSSERRLFLSECLKFCERDG